MKALLYLIDLNDCTSNESSTTVNRLTARKLFEQWKINRLSNSRDREPSRIPGGECFFPRCMVILRFIGILEPPGGTPRNVGWGCAARFPKPLPYL